MSTGQKKGSVSFSGGGDGFQAPREAGGGGDLLGACRQLWILRTAPPRPLPGVVRNLAGRCTHLVGLSRT